MGRPPLAVGTWGDISVAWSEREGAFKARARYRDADGVVRPVAKFAKTKGGAERALKDALRDRQRASGLAISGDMLVRDLLEEWLGEVERSDLAIGTKQQYARNARTNVLPALGALRVGEVRVSICDRALRTINQRNGYAVAKTSRAVMSGAFGLAVRHDALPANPVRDAGKLSRNGTAPKTPRALATNEMRQLTDRLRTIRRAVDLDLPDLADFMLMTGCRVGEALACRLDATNADGQRLVDLSAGTWEINSTVIRVLGVKRLRQLEQLTEPSVAETAELARVRQVPPGLYVQEHAKSEAGWRIIALPPAAVQMLRRRNAEARLRPRHVPLVDANGRTRHEPSRLLFPSPAARTLRDPNNAEGDLREVLDRIGCNACSDTGYQLTGDGDFKLTSRSRRVRCAEGPWSWVTSHTFRKTVATRMEEAGCTARQVADHLGHSKISMTQDVYFGRSVVVAEAAEILQPS